MDGKFSKSQGESLVLGVFSEGKQNDSIVIGSNQRVNSQTH